MPGLWHHTYLDSIAFRVGEDLLSVMFRKVATGACFGILLSAAGMKAKSCHAAIVLHGVINLFGR